MTRFVYCKDSKHRPIRIGPAPAFRDIQADVPFGWCDLCSCEIFEAGHDRCPRCRRRKGENR